MKNNSLYENLDTAFVDLDALVRYLRRRKFVGRLHIAFTGYEGEITFTAEGKLRVSEHDKIAGRMADGERAFVNIIARAKESGGIINVAQEVSESKAKTPAIVSPVKGMPYVRPNGQKSGPPNGNGAAGGGLLEHINIAQIDEESDAKRPDFPFPLTNEVEEKARLVRRPAGDSETLVRLTSELLRSVDQALEKANLNFSEAFAKACGELSSQFPFMDPAQGDFEYLEGKVKIHELGDPQGFVDGVGEALGRIFARLNSVPRLGKVYRFASQRVRALNRERRDLYDRFMMTPMIERVLQA